MYVPLRSVALPFKACFRYTSAMRAIAEVCQRLMDGIFLNIAQELVRSVDLRLQEFGVMLYRLLFKVFSDVYSRQELLSTIVTHIGSGNVRMVRWDYRALASNWASVPQDLEIDAALATLLHLANDHVEVLVDYIPFLKGINEPRIFG